MVGRMLPFLPFLLLVAAVVFVVLQSAIQVLRRNRNLRQLKERIIDHQQSSPKRVEALVLDQISKMCDLPVCFLATDVTLKILDIRQHLGEDDGEICEFEEQMSNALGNRIYWNYNWRTLMDVVEGIELQLNESRCESISTPSNQHR
jgi:porphobilinogen deaminase